MGLPVGAFEKATTGKATWKAPQPWAEGRWRGREEATLHELEDSQQVQPGNQNCAWDRDRVGDGERGRRREEADWLSPQDLNKQLHWLCEEMSHYGYNYSPLGNVSDHHGNKLQIASDSIFQHGYRCDIHKESHR